NDFERLRDSGAAVAHCPTVFARRAMVLNSIGRYMDAGIPVGIGTDTFPHNMVDEIRLVCYAARVFTGNYKMGTTRHAFEPATIGGANILRQPCVVGRAGRGAQVPARARPGAAGARPQGRLLAGRHGPSLHAAEPRAGA